MLLHYLGLLFMVDKVRSPVRSRPSVMAQMVKKKICLPCRRPGFDPRVGKIPRRGEWLPTLGFLPENPIDRGACRAATVLGVAKSRTQLGDSHTARENVTVPYFGAPSCSLFISPSETAHALSVECVLL